MVEGDGGHGDVPLVNLKFRCSYCGHREIDAVITPRPNSRSTVGHASLKTGSDAVIIL
jgi:hypothetical protein